MNAQSVSNNFTIVAFGDSTTAARGKLVIYARILQTGLRSKSGAVRVINAGIGGNNTVMARARFEKDVLAHAPNLVIIQFGINDSAVDVWKTPPASKPRVGQQEYEDNLRYFIRTLKAKEAQVILMTPNALRWTPGIKERYGRVPYNPDDPEGFNLYLRAYAEAVRNIARVEGVALIDVYGAFEQYGRQSGQAMDNLLLDGMHPNEKGHRLVADLLLKEIVALNPDISVNPTP